MSLQLMKFNVLLEWGSFIVTVFFKKNNVQEISKIAFLEDWLQQN